MTKPATEHNNLAGALDYLEALIDARLAIHLGKESRRRVEAPDLVADGDRFGRFLREKQPEYPEYVALLLALAPHLRVDLFDRVLERHLDKGAHFPVFGGIRGKNHRGLLPTVQTLQFIIGGEDLTVSTGVLKLFAAEHWFAKSGILSVEQPPPGEPFASGQLLVSQDWIDHLLTGRVSHPTFSPGFPAQRLDTHLEWDDLVLPERSLSEIAYLRNYLSHHEKLSGDPAYGRHNRRGYRALFHGPPGTGKTLTATLLGKSVGKPVFRVDLSMVVSKWIGETEKNLSGLFDRAESKGWILFFDEADALFSKRGEVKESRDKYANQETSFLLQRVENYDGLCILATNFRQNLDKAFTRRFESIVPFSPPTAGERHVLWQKMWPESHGAAGDVDLEGIARQYELSGASIANAIRHAVYEAVAADRKELGREALLLAIRREYDKEDRMFPAE